ncbi:hypothetical protein PYJP_12600 [Pyrofollis japonicus]|nr:hypothetical protein PYJP_12600 [Pyrofollis japonicus]
MQSRLVKSYGHHMIVEGHSFYSFPDLERIAKASVGELRSIGLTRMRTEAIKAIAVAEHEGGLPSVRDVERTEDLPGIVRELTRLRGWGLGLLS